MSQLSALVRPFLVVCALSAAACGSDGDANPNVDDPLANEDVVRCDMPADHACREYNRGQQGDATAFVDLPAARKSCVGGWPGGPPDAGVFGAGSCSKDDALGRCVTQSQTIAVLVTIDYFYTGFADGTATTDQLQQVCANVQANAAAHGVQLTSVFQSPPF
ncbi:MAG TPA: hypothetical protein VFQ35_21625 [Polyangiaceae bacterium]|nr:hypothetical protein [Polyangiaceae bacterium]